MLRIRTFGGLFVEGESLNDGGATQQRRPLAVLALLAVAGNAGISRDRIAGLLWPESTSDRAFNTLRQWLFKLRRDLQAPDAITGTAELRLNPDIITSDIAEFRDALERGELERAMGLYRGPFLDGFHLPNAPEFERWQRDVAHETAVQTARTLQRLATDSGQRGDHEVAIGWWRRLAALDPLNVRVTIGLMNALAASGDIAGAIKHAHIHASLTQHELGMPPDGSIVTLANELHVTAAARAGSARELPAVISNASAENLRTTEPARAAIDDRRAHLAFPTRTALWTALAVLVAIAGTALQRNRFATLGVGRPHAAAAAENVVAVLPFGVAGDGTLAYLREGMVSLLTTDIDGTGTLRAVNAQSILTATGSTKNPTRSIGDGAALARRLGAGRFVVGDIVRVGPTVQMNATVYNTNDADSAFADVSVAGDTSRIIGLSAELARKLLAALHPGVGDRLVRSAASVTTSLEAYRHYLDGEALFRRGEYAAASAAFQRAVAVDSTFALAYYRLSLSADWAGGVDLMRWAAERATRLRSRLSMHDADMLSGLLAWHDGRADDAEHIYRMVLDAYPDDVDAWYQLGEVQFHLSPLHGHSVLESRAAFEHAFHYRPDNREALVHLLRLAAKAHDSIQIDTLTRTLIAGWPAGDTLGLVAFRAFTIGTERDQNTILSPLAAVSDEGLMQVALKVALFGENFPGAEHIARLLTDEARAPVYQVIGHLYLGFLAMAEGRRAAAESSFVAAQRPARPTAHGPAHVSTDGLRALVYALPDLPATQNELEEARLLATRWRGPSGDDLAMGFLDSRLAPFVEGVLDARLDDTTAANEAARRLLHARGASPPATLLREMANTVRGANAIARKQFTTAQAQLEEPLCALDPASASDVAGTRVVRRYMRGILLDTLGRMTDAVRWFDSIGGVGMAELMLLAPAQLREAKLYERLGDKNSAAIHYRRFIELWRNADPEFQPVVRGATLALRRLVAGTK